MASALVQMTAFSPCSQLGDMIMIGMEASLESFPGTREEGNKRSHSDGDEEQDRSHVKKRRKQSKPIRITAADSIPDSKEDSKISGQHTTNLDFSETGEHFLTEGLADGNTGSLSAIGDYGDLDKIAHIPHKTCEDNQNGPEHSDKSYDSLLPLNLSNIKSSFVDSLIVPSINENQSAQNKLDNNSSQFQPKPNERSKTPVGQDGSYLPHSSSLLLPLFKQTQIQNQISQITSQIRIFNPEAFCDLCNKEFCNKYFLKTHKANKHGIYTESPSGPTFLDPMSTLPFANYFSTSNDSYENSQIFQTTNTSKTLLSQPTYSANRSVPKKSQTIQQQQPQPNSLFSVKSSSSGNMRALCNICQREFCNKYFVRRHKLKIHGIIDPAAKDGSVVDSQEINSIISNISQDKLDLSMNDSEAHTGFVKPFIPNLSVDAKDSSQNVDFGIERLKEKSDQEPDSENQVPQIPLNIPVSSESSSFFKMCQNEENNKENALSSMKLKKLGVVNADAFCDICCKEYCNKYFLRTHKLKSHGILPVEEKRDDLMGGTGSALSWYQNQSAPLNLIVNEAINNDSPQKFGFDVEEECICNICGRYFQSQFLLRMHQAYTHPNKNINDVLPPSKNITKQFDPPKIKDLGDCERLQQQPMELYSPVIKHEYSKEQQEEEENKLVVNTEHLQKLQTLIARLNNSNNCESSMCDVCEKDVGHVSLLENHILKEHAVLLEEMGNVTEEDNSSSQSSLVVSLYSYKKECLHCQQIFLKPSLFEQHMSEAHSDVDIANDPESLKRSTDSPLKMSVIPYTTQSLEERQGVQTPASSFCEICKKELCNKYFMKTHMQRMHGIAIENGAQIGGVVCDICNKELCSKYFLRVHKQNSHGIVDELFLPQVGLDFGGNQSPNGDPALKPSDQADLCNRYFTHFNEVCMLCNRRFRSVKWLKAHLWNDHGEEGKKKCKDIYSPSISESKTYNFEENLKESGKKNELPALFGSSSIQPCSAPNLNDSSLNGKEPTEGQNFTDKNILNNTVFSMLMNGKDSETKHYQCSYCSFTTTILAFLFIHERSHMSTRSFQSESDQSFQCPFCFQSMDSKDLFEKHILLHKMSWQQPSNNQRLETSKVSATKSETKCELNAPKERDAQQEQESTEGLSHYETTRMKPKPMPNNQPEHTSRSSMQCTRCSFGSNNVQAYLDHVSREHSFLQTDQDLPSNLQIMEKALSSLASNAGIPAVFAVPRSQEHITMQPFVLEDSEYKSDSNSSIDFKSGKTFLSSLVFLPVKEKLKHSVTASFKLTPT